MFAGGRGRGKPILTHFENRRIVRAKWWATRKGPPKRIAPGNGLSPPPPLGFAVSGFYPKPLVVAQVAARGFGLRYTGATFERPIAASVDHVHANLFSHQIEPPRHQTACRTNPQRESPSSSPRVHEAPPARERWHGNTLWIARAPEPKRGLCGDLSAEGRQVRAVRGDGQANRPANNPWWRRIVDV